MRLRHTGTGDGASAPPPGAAEITTSNGVVVAGHAAPVSASATRSVHMRALMHSRGFVWAMTIGCAATFLAGAATGRVLLAAAGPAAVVLIAVVIAYARAASLATADFFTGFARQHEFRYSERVELEEITPLLGAGDRRRCDHYMEGNLSTELPGARVGLSLYTYEVASERSDRRGRTVETWTPYRFTICVVELQRAITSYPGVFLTRRRGLLGRISGDTWLNYDQLRPIELESSSLAGKYELLVRRNQDETRLLELFQPSFQMWLSELPMELCFEYSGGTLVTYIQKPASDWTSLEILLEATAKVAERILKKGEPLRPAAVPAAAAPPPQAPTLKLVDSPSVPPPPMPPSTVVPPGVTPLHGPAGVSPSGAVPLPGVSPLNGGPAVPPGAAPPPPTPPSAPPA